MTPVALGAPVADLAHGRALSVNLAEEAVAEGSDVVYLDYAATTPLDPEVVRSMVAFLEATTSFGNAASTHVYGLAAAEAVEHARKEVASLLFARPEEIIWTSGATEAINLALKGVAFARQSIGRHIVTSPLEHKAVLDTILCLEAQGFEVSYIRPDEDGAITATGLAVVLRPDTILVSLMHVNNETGVITDIAGLEPVLRRHPALLHVDAAQSTARLSMQDISFADFISISAHKMYGPKGVGALRVRRPFLTQLVPQMHGGNHESGLRSGTLATHQVVGMGRAAAVVQRRRCGDTAHVRSLDGRLRWHLDRIDGAECNDIANSRAAGILNVAFRDVEADSLMLALGDVAVSTGSACTSTDLRPSHVLTALGYDEPRARSSVRISIGRFTTVADIDHIVSSLIVAVESLRRLAQ